MLVQRWPSGEQGMAFCCREESRQHQSKHLRQRRVKKGTDARRLLLTAVKFEASTCN